MSAGIGAADAAIYTGICVESTDPTGQGRVQFQVPQLSGTAAFGWANPVYPGVTPVGAYIYIAFEGGDRNRPLYWPADAPPISYATYAAMSSANPLSSTPVGTQYYVVDHGGNVQIQNTGVSGAPYKWQWLPGGFQGSGSNAADVTATGSTASLVAYTSLTNPSAKRQYRISVDSQVWTSASGGPLAGLALITSTTAPANTLPAFTTSWIVSRAASVGVNNSGVSAASAVSLAYSHLVSNVTAGLVYCAIYLMNNYGNGNTVTTSANQTQIVVDDVGAVT